MQAVRGKGLGPRETGGPLQLMVLSLVVGTQTSKYRHTKPPAQELEMCQYHIFWKNPFA